MKKIIIAVVILMFFLPTIAYATEEEEKIMAELDTDTVDEMLEEMFPNRQLKFTDILAGLTSGELEFSFSLVFDVIKDQFAGCIQEQKASMIRLLALILVAAVFTNFSNVFQSRQVSEIGFYVIYMILITISIGTFRMLIEMTADNLEQLTSFMKVLSPVYFIATALATGSITSIAFYNIVLIVIFLVEMFVLTVVIPLVQIFLLCRLMNYLAIEDYLSKLAEFLQTIIVWTMKTILAAIIGLNIIQGILGPAIDSVKRSVLTRGAEAVPVVGDAVGGVTEVFLGTATVIKNGIGIAGALICVVIVLVPLIQVAIVTLLYKLMAAIVQPISDKRIVGCISSVADGTAMLLRVVFTTGMLFLLTIAVVAATAGG